MSDRISEVLDRIEAQHAATAEAEPASALGYLQDVYRGRRQADPWRMRAALGAVQFESPKLTAMAIGNMNGETFVAMLDRAILRSQGNGRNIPQIELKPEPEGR
jgi:hypothetical protein